MTAEWHATPQLHASDWGGGIAVEADAVVVMAEQRGQDVAVDERWGGCNAHFDNLFCQSNEFAFLYSSPPMAASFQIKMNAEKVESSAAAWGLALGMSAAAARQGSCRRGGMMSFLFCFYLFYPHLTGVARTMRPWPWSS